MSRRQFMSNLIGSVSLLVIAYALPLQRVQRMLDPRPNAIGEVFYEPWTRGGDPIWGKQVEKYLGIADEPEAVTTRQSFEESNIGIDWRD